MASYVDRKLEDGCLNQMGSREWYDLLNEPFRGDGGQFIISKGNIIEGIEAKQ